MLDVGKGHLTLTDRVYQALLEAILNSRLRVGERITIQQLTEQMQVSATPIKQALARLNEQGLVSTDRKQGVKVIQLSKMDVIERFELRRMFELYAVEKGFSRGLVDEDFFEKLVGLYEAHRVGFERSVQEQELAELDRKFHFHIITLADNEQLASWYENLNNHIHMMLFQAKQTQPSKRNVVAEHHAIVTAFEHADSAGAKKALEQHLDNVHRKLDALMKELSRSEGEQSGT